MPSARATRLVAACLGTLLGIAAVGGAAYAYWALARHRFLTVTEGQVYRSAAMPPERLIEVVERHGIRSVVDFRAPSPEVVAERAALAEAGINHFHVPSRQVPKDESIEAFLELMVEPENRPVLLHCEHGIGRAPLYSAIYRVEFEGWSQERARSTAYWRSGLGDFEPEDDKGSYLLDYQPRRADGG